MTGEKFVLVVSDLHVGSAFGLFPPAFRGSTGAVVNLNTGQDYLLKCWEHFLGSLPDRVDALFVNGDAVDGINDKEDGRFLSEVDPQFQARAAHELLKPIVERVPEVDGKRQIRLARGSRYHVGVGGEGEEFLGSLLGAIPGPDGRFTRPWMRVEINDCLFDVAHRQSVTIRYRGMPLEREISFFLERMARQRLVVSPRVIIVRSHTHGPFREYRDGSVRAVATPSWKLQDDFATSSISPNRLFSEWLGAVGWSIGTDEMTTCPYLYKHPLLPVEVIE